jgi:membrane protease YdiL (CAAX protease family)
VARVIPIDPDRLVHVVALHYAGLLVIFGLALAAIMPEAARSEEALRELETEMRSGGLALLWYQCIGFVIMAFLGAGLFIRRDWRQTLERLGLTAPVDVRWVVGIPVLGLASGWVVDTLTARALGPAGLADVERITDALFGPLIEMGLAGGISVALSAAIGEELVFRGAAQPRLGLTLTAVLFMLVHMQYTLSPALVQIFVMGLLLGVARMRSGTWTTMLAHALYDGVVFGIALMGHSASP